MDKHKLALINEAINSNNGKMIIEFIKEYMVELASHQNSNAEWLKGIGMSLGRLNDLQTEYQNLKSKERN
jgi:hypothetical protein